MSYCGILTPCKVVIEIQHSTISSQEIYRRDRFYGEPMLWVINAKEFKHNLIFKQYPINADKDIWWRWISQDVGTNVYKAVIPVNDDGQILKALQTNNFLRKFSEGGTREWWERPYSSFRPAFPQEVLNAFKNYLIDQQLISSVDDNRIPGTNFKWMHLRKNWTISMRHKFLDLNNGYLFLILRLYENGNGYGKIVAKRSFLKKYLSSPNP